MDLFYLKALLSGKLLTTDKYETKSEQIQEGQIRYRQLEKTEKVQRYAELEKIVNSAEFQSKKKSIEKTKYNKTEEYKKLAKFTELSKDKYVKAYLKDGSEAGRSSVQRYLDLKAEVESEDFKKRNAFWEDPHRWSATEEGKLEAEYNELKKDDDIIFFSNANVAAFQKVEQYELIFEDHFKWSGLNQSDWKPGFIYPNEHYVNVHSYMNEQQAFTGGKNIETANERLYIQTRKEDCEGLAWDEKKGLITKKFKYSSDAIYTDKVAIEEDSIVQVKVRCRGMLNHGIYLRSKNHVPFISLFDYTGFKLYCGVKDSLQHDRNLKFLNGLQPIPFTIFSVIWKKDEIIWYVNNLEVFRTKNLIPKGEKLYLHMYSFLFENARYASEGALEVDWIRAYKIK